MIVLDVAELNPLALQIAGRDGDAFERTVVGETKRLFRGTLEASNRTQSATLKDRLGKDVTVRIEIAPARFPNMPGKAMFVFDDDLEITGPGAIHGNISLCTPNHSIKVTGAAIGEDVDLYDRGTVDVQSPSIAKRCKFKSGGNIIVGATTHAENAEGALHLSIQPNQDSPIPAIALPARPEPPKSTGLAGLLASLKVRASPAAVPEAGSRTR